MPPVINSLGGTELEITVGHQPFSDQFQDLAEQIQFARTNLLHIFNGKAKIVYKMFLLLLNGQLISNPYFKLWGWTYTHTYRRRHRNNFKKPVSLLYHNLISI